MWSTGRPRTRQSVRMGLLGPDGDRRSQYPPAIRTPPQLDGDVTVFRGVGARVARSNLTVPLVTLAFDADWLRIRRIMRHCDVWIERSRVISVRAVGSTWFSAGVMFDTADGRYDGVIVWIRRGPRAALIGLLEERGWPVAPGLT